MNEKEKLESLTQLKKYVRINNLQNNVGVIRFNSEIYIQTTQRKNIFHSESGIEFGGYNNLGKLTIYDRNNMIDPYLYPTEFAAEWQQFKISDEGNLFIEGTHSQNNKIGKYTVIIKITKIIKKNLQEDRE